MNEKENALRILNFSQPERVVEEMPTYILQYTGVNHERQDGSGGHHLPVGSQWTDIWGTGWHKIHTGVMGMPVFNPLAEIGALKNYNWPDPDDERICGKIYQMKEQFTGGDVFLAGSHRDTLWEKSYMLVGMENMMAYFLTEPGYAREILHQIMDFQLGIARHYLACGVEFVQLGDDLGTQTGLLLSPRVIREFLLPEYRRIFELYRQNGVIIGFHSCGKIEAVLDTFMELGIAVLNPIQATANDLDALRKRTQGKMALQGGVSSGVVMAGPRERIEAEVRQRLMQLGRDGGYFCGPDQGMPYPEGNLAALQDAVEKYGRYPVGRN
jgi:uroporphyrinogen decarboxylase